MHSCQTCGKPLGKRQRMFCSIICRNSANGKKQGGWNRDQLSIKCENCGDTFSVPRHRATTARACSRGCLGAIQSRERAGIFGVGPLNPGWKDGRSPIYYRRFLKEKCEWCGSTKLLLIHHADENRGNNNPANLVTLCKACHQRHHSEPRREMVTGRFS